jgi:hypothetical protein
MFDALIIGTDGLINAGLVSSAIWVAGMPEKRRSFQPEADQRIAN